MLLSWSRRYRPGMRLVALSALLLAIAAPADAQPVPPNPTPPVEPTVEPPPGPDPTPPPSPGKHHRRDRPAKPVKPRHRKVHVSGYLTALYKFRIEQNGDGIHDPDAFRLGKATVRVSGRIDRRFGYVVEIDPRSPTILGVLRDGYVTLRLLRGHEVRLGQQKTPFGYENWQGSTTLYTVSRAEESEGLGRGVTHRDLGIGLVGKIKVTDDLRVEDAVALVNGAGFGVQADDTQMKNLWARIGVRYRPGAGELVVHAGLSGAIGDQMGEPDPGPPVVPAKRFGFRRLGADLEIDQRWFYASTEAAIGWTETPAESGNVESQLAYSVLVAGKSRWHVGPVIRYDADDGASFRRITAGGYWGEPAAKARALLDYEWFEDDAGAHDGRVTAEVIAKF